MRPPFIQSLRPRHLTFFLGLCVVLLGLKQADMLPTQADPLPGAFKPLGASAHRLADARIESTFILEQDSLRLQLLLPLPETGKVTIRKLGGAVMLQWDWVRPVAFIEQALNISNLTNGVYFVRVETERYQTVRVLNLS